MPSLKLEYFFNFFLISTVRPVVLSNTRLRIYDIPEQKFQFEGSTKT